MPIELDSVYSLLREVVRSLDEKKAADLRVLQVSAQSTITDYLVVATGTSEPHLRALRVELEKVLDAHKAPIAGMDTGEPGSGWTVVDAYQMMVHLFTQEKRDEYRLENLWQDAEEISIAELMNPDSVAKVAKPRAPKPKVVKSKAPKKASVKTKSGAKKTAVKVKAGLKKAATKAKPKGTAKGKAKKKPVQKKRGR